MHSIIPTEKHIKLVMNESLNLQKGRRFNEKLSDAGVGDDCGVVWLVYWKIDRIRINKKAEGLKAQELHVGARVKNLGTLLKLEAREVLSIADEKANFSIKIIYWNLGEFLTEICLSSVFLDRIPFNKCVVR